jgi:hypothetical protein
MFVFFLSLLALAAFVRAGFEAAPTIEVETLHIIEYTEVCECHRHGDNTAHYILH